MASKANKEYIFTSNNYSIISLIASTQNAIPINDPAEWLPQHKHIKNTEQFLYI